jgi:hypothetical protein
MERTVYEAFEQREYRHIQQLLVGWQPVARIGI